MCARMCAALPPERLDGFCFYLLFKRFVCHGRMFRGYEYVDPRNGLPLHDPPKAKLRFFLKRLYRFIVGQMNSVYMHTVPEYLF